MAKQIIFDTKARASLVRGINMVAKTVGLTIGPKGKNVAFQRSYGAPMVTNDGATVAKEIELKDPFENMGAQLIREAASKTNDVAGDGTTTATVLTQALVLEGYKLVSAGSDGLALKRGLDKAVERVTKFLQESSKEVSESNAIGNVATISAGDSSVGELIAEVMQKVGRSGVVTVEEGNKIGLTTEYTEGMNFDRGYITPYMVTQSEGMVAEYKNCYVLVTDKKISNIQEIIPILEKVAKEGKKELVIIAEDVDGEALATIIINKLKGTFNILAVKAPAFGDRRKAMLQDIAILTGGNVITDELGLKLEQTELSDLGKARTIISTKDATTVVVEESEERKQAIQDRVKQIKSELNASSSDYDKEKLQERIAKLSGGVGVIKVGAATEVELKEKKLRIEDALNATRAAIEEGLVVGGGCALVHTLDDLDELKLSNADEQAGVDIVKRAIVAPLRLIAENAGAPADVILDEVRKASKNKDFSYGFDASTNTFGNLFEKGIVDPVKVTRLALANAASVAGMVLTIGALVSDLPKEEKESGASGMGMPGGMGMDDMDY